MPSWWFLRAKPSEEPTPDDGYDAFFSGDGTEGTTAGTLYRKDFNGVVTPVGGTGGGGGGSYTDEQAQDAVGRILFDTPTVDVTYNDSANTITAAVVAGSIGTTQLAANAVTNAVLADMPGATVKGRPAGAAGDPQDLNSTALKALMSFTSTDIGDFTEAAQDAVGASLTDTASIHLGYNDTANTITGQVQANGITTAMIAPNAVGSLQLGANVVTNDKLAQMPAKTLKGNKTTALAPATDITVPDVKAMLVYTAAEIAVVPFGTITSTNVQAALEALYALILAGGGGDPPGGYVTSNDFAVLGPANSYVKANISGTVFPYTDLAHQTTAVTDSTDTTYVVGDYIGSANEFKHWGGVKIGDFGAFAFGQGAVESFTFTVRFQNPLGTAYLALGNYTDNSPPVIGVRTDPGVVDPNFSPFTGAGIQEATSGTFFAGPNQTFADGALANLHFGVSVWGKDVAVGTADQQPRIYSIRLNVKYV